VLRGRAHVGILREDSLRGKRKEHGNQGCRRKSDQAVSETAVIGARTSGTIGKSGG
jgi:hypothetical protein